jgi:hypothetical protein
MCPSPQSIEAVKSPGRAELESINEPIVTGALGDTPATKLIAAGIGVSVRRVRGSRLSTKATDGDRRVRDDLLVPLGRLSDSQNKSMAGKAP